MPGVYGAGVITLAQWPVRFRHLSATDDRQGNTGLSQEETHLLLPADAAWLALERPDNPLTITVMMRVEGLTPDRLEQFLRDYWLSWDRFHFYPERRATGWWWQRDHAFSLRHHLEVVDEPFSESQLQDWVSARLNEPLPDYRPRWKFWLAPRAEGGAALVLRIHHCYGDGLSLMGIFRRLCPPSPQQAPVLYGARENADFLHWSRRTATWLWNLLEQTLKLPENDRLADPARWSRQRLGKLVERFAGRGYRAVNEIGQFLGEPEDSDSGLSRSLLGRRHCCWSRPLAAEPLREAARRAGVTVNDLLLQGVTAALRQHLHRSDLSAEEAVLHAAMPMDIRNRLPEGIRPASGALGNCFGTVFVPLPVDGASALEQLYRVKHETRKFKRGWQPVISWALAGAAVMLPETWRQSLADLLCRKASVVVSNMPGTRRHRYIAGCRITGQMFWVPQAGNIGLGVSFVSYAGQVCIGVVADEAVMEDPAAFLESCVSNLHRTG